ncbi:hypothetical protein AB0G60_04815 [Streptomyces angustmyceticus]|nr:hypothetical protein [Streptomyces angustmyceticus]
MPVIPSRAHPLTHISSSRYPTAVAGKLPVPITSPSEETTAAA